MKALPAILLALLCVRVAYAQQTVTGKVTEEGDEFGLAGVLVTVKGTDVSTITDVYGEYSLAVPDGATTIVFSGEGFATMEVEIGSTTSIDFQMQKGKKTKKEAKGTRFVPVGFGTQTESEITSSISQIDAQQLEGIPTIDLEQANQGRASGLQVQNNGGQLGEGTSVRIRGGSSLSASNEPLYVVDGVPLSSGGQSDINPHNIASIEILKDASAAAIYGSRAANGVVLITTKRGESGKTKIDVDYQFGVSQTPRKLDLYTPEDYNAQFLEFGLRDVEPELGILAFFNPEARDLWFLVLDILDEGSADNYRDWASTGTITLDDGRTLVLSENTLLNLIAQPLDSLIYDTDWQDEVYQTAFAHRANLGVSGGSDSFNYYAGVSFTDQEGILIGNDFQRINGRLDLNSEVLPGLDIDLSANYAYTKNNRLRDNQDLGFPLQAIVLPPSDSYDPADDYNLIVRSLEYNPLAEIAFSDNLELGNSIIGDIGIAYEITDGLTINVEGGIDFFDQDAEHRQGPGTLEGGQTGLSSLTEVSIRNYVYNAFIDYSLPLSNEQQLSFLGGASYQESTTTTAFRSARVNSISELSGLDESDSTLLNVPIPDTRFSFLSFYARATYNIRDRYIFQLSGRADGSSRFSEDNRMGYFPAASFGWNISNEDFFDPTVFNLLKLKASYGLVGNTPEEDFLYRSNYFEILYGQEPGIRLSNLANSQLKWETTAQTDVGVELGLFNSRINLTVDAYMKNTTDLLFPVPITQTTGFSFILQNLGSLTNQGIELALGTVNIDGENFTWSTDFNITMNRNEVTDLNGNQLIVGVNAYLEDQPAGVFYTRKYVGVDPNTGEALYDNGAGGTTTDWNNAPRMVVGDPNPDFFGGLSNTLSYKDISLTFLFQFVSGSDVYNATQEFLSNSGILNLSQSKDQLNRWYKPGDEAPFPALNPFQENTFPSSRFIEDGSYIRLNTATITYNLPADVVSNWGLSYLRFYVGGQNLITFSNYSGYDPDVNYVDPTFGTIERNISRNIDNFNIPQARTIITGFKIGF